MYVSKSEAKECEGVAMNVRRLFQLFPSVLHRFRRLGYCFSAVLRLRGRLYIGAMNFLGPK